MYEDDAPPRRLGGWGIGGGWNLGYGPRHAAVPPAQMRVSDAERSAVAEALSNHFADGRLDQVELDERMTKAMSAKTRGDLAGLLDDLPPPPRGHDDGPPTAAPAIRRRRDGASALALVVVLAILAQTTFGGWLGHPAGLWICLIGVALLLIQRSRRRPGGDAALLHRHHHHDW
jgi:hypothetical protein